MKHVFIVNPTAGKKSSLEIIENALKNEEIDYEIYVTKCIGDAKEFSKKKVLEDPTTEYRFYACGGDGTVNEVINGIYGHSNASFSVYPCGSGNDFVKASRGKDFTNIHNLINGEEKAIDVIKVNDCYGVNIFNAGFDASVAYNMVKFKRWPLVSGKMAYNLGLIKSLFTDMSHKGEIYADDKLLFSGKFLMTSLCNGICCGGAFYFAPNANIDDGRLYHLLVKKVGLIKFLSLVGKFKTGEYINYPEKYGKIILNDYYSKVRIVTKKPLKCGIDGETFLSNDITIEVIPSSLRFVCPK